MSTGRLAESSSLHITPTEKLADGIRIGLECTGEEDESGGSKTYDRFTVKKEAVIGVILMKLGHDKAFEQRQEHVVY
jgi:hypothetical protein